MEKLCLLFVLALLGVKNISAQDLNSSPSSSIDDCIRNCPVTPEYNPVCGTNGVTYDNPGRLLCAKACGVDVSRERWGRCPPRK